MPNSDSQYQTSREPHVNQIDIRAGLNLGPTLQLGPLE